MYYALNTKIAFTQHVTSSITCIMNKIFKKYSPKYRKEVLAQISKKSTHQYREVVFTIPEKVLV